MFARIVSCIGPSRRSSYSRATTAAAFWTNDSFDERVLQESAALVLKISQEASKQLASSVAANRGRSRVSSHFQCEQRKPWRWPKFSPPRFLRVYKHNPRRSKTKSLLKHAQAEDTRFGAFTRGKNTYVKTWRLKGRRLLKGGVFLDIGAGLQLRGSKE